MYIVAQFTPLKLSSFRLLSTPFFTSTLPSFSFPNTCPSTTPSTLLLSCPGLARPGKTCSNLPWKVVLSRAVNAVNAC